MLLRKICPAVMIVCMAVPCLAGREGGNPKRDRVRTYLQRSAVIVMKAKAKVDENRVYTGHLAKAVAHQKFAIRLYREGRYGPSLHHSRRARQLAVTAIRANSKTGRVEPMKELEDTDDPGKGPSDSSLDTTIAQEMSSETAKDELVSVNTTDISPQ